MKVIADRMTVRTEEDFVVFLIGMRLNKPWKFWKWLPIFFAMPRMQKELAANREHGCLATDFWLGRTIISVQYWRSAEHLQRYARDRNSEHLPAWRAFNRQVGKSGDVGIFHETYPISKDAYEVIYANMPVFGLGNVTKPIPVRGNLESAAERLQKSNR